jgi:glycosyltransferase involved in cell wall biosynthesis
MKIGMVTRTVTPFDRGGIQRHVGEISKALVKEGVEVHIFIVGKALGMNKIIYPNTPVKETVSDDGVHLHPVNVLPVPRFTLGEYLSYSINTVKYLKKFDLDLINGQAMYSFGIALKKILPLVVTVHGPQVAEFKMGYDSGLSLNHMITDAASVFMEGYSARKADLVIVDNEHNKKIVMDRYRVDERKIRPMVMEGVDLNLYQPSSCEGNVILFVGRLHERKGLDLLLPIFKKVLDKEEAHLKIVGSGEMEKSLRSQVDKLGIQKNVEFMGYLSDSDMQNEYSKASFFISPSRYEGFGIVLLEALASGLPLVATNTGISSKVIEENKNGFLVNYENMEEAILRLLRDQNLRMNMGHRSREIAQDYSWRRVAKGMISVYEELI